MRLKPVGTRCSLFACACLVLIGLLDACNRDAPGMPLHLRARAAKKADQADAAGRDGAAATTDAAAVAVLPPAQTDAAPAAGAPDAAQPPADAAGPDADLDSGSSFADANVDASISSDASTEVKVPTPQPAGCLSALSVGQSVYSCDGLDFHVNVPPHCLFFQCGLILDVHGGTMNAKMEDNNTNMVALGGQYGYVVLQPNANNGLFDASTDDAKVLAFAKNVIAVFHLDEKRVHMTGFSQGGYMTWRFICQHTDFLASAAPAAAAGMANISLETDCSFTGSDRPSGELDILYMHGRQDALVDFQNAQAKRDAVVTAFEMGPGLMLAGDATYQRNRYVNARGTVFEFIDHDYVSASSFPLDPPLGVAIKGHCYPGSSDQTPTEPDQLMSFGCVPPNSFVWGQTVIAFFMAHPKR